MANADDSEELLDRLAERLKAIREDAELARSGGHQGISAALDRTQAHLHDLANGLEALSLQVEQQHALAERAEAAAAKGEAETKTLKQTVEALSVRLQQQAEMLDGLSARTRSRLTAARIMVAITLLLAGTIAVILASGHVVSFGSLQRPMVDRLFEFGSINPSSPTGPKSASETSNPEPAPASQGVVPAAAVAYEPAAPASTDDIVASGSGSISPAPAVPAPAPPPDPKLPMQTPVATVPLPAPPSAVDDAQLPATATAAMPVTGAQFSSAGAETPPPLSAAAEPSPGQTPAAEISPPRESLAPVARMPTAGLQDSPVVMTENSAAAAPEPGESPPVDVSQQSATRDRIAKITASQTIPPVPAAPIHATSKQNARRQLVLKATADSWVRVRTSDDRTLFSRIMRKGETHRVDIDAGAILDTGNAAGLEVEVEGVPISLAGARGGVVRAVPLDTTPGGSASRP